MTVQCETCGFAIDQAGEWRCLKCAARPQPLPYSHEGPYARVVGTTNVRGPGFEVVVDSPASAEEMARALNHAWRAGLLETANKLLNDLRASNSRAEGKTREASTMIAEARRGLSAIRAIHASRRCRDYAMVFSGMACAAGFGYWSPSTSWGTLGLIAVLACLVCALRCMALASRADRDLSGAVEGKPE